ncbi:MAG: hybrid sensor histidine kinase/response regulator, partial [Leptospiraceae bacterium]|nr:hybrid sensor histidine kinase/response regulator [Leptospiraceae bacterium]
FSPKGGKIKFTTYRDNYKILIIIEDNGTGIPEKILPYLFDKSVKTSKKGTEGELGHGLGLIYAYDSIKLLQGQISASNRPKGGASFCIEIPDNEKTMLIADDSNEYRRNLADAFRRENWLVLEASDGEEVLEILCNIIPDILITDKNMPRMGGIEVINYLQENPDYENIIIFLLSADFSRENLIEIQANNDPTLKRIRAFLPRFENIDWIKKKVMQVYKYEE